MLKYKKVFIIDDDPISVLISKKLMEITAFSEVIISFTNCNDALGDLQDHVLKEQWQSLPQMILLDINLPDLGGWDFIARFIPLIAEQGILPRINFFSATINEEDRERAMQIPYIKNLLLKPLKKEHLHLL